ncbi:hypothetical protein AB4343_07010 [Vibrio breoganii]|uniref:DUF5329 domain-containing protein n=2 Tax=Vibrio TaxID=662 RepID=A0AAJ5JP27_9VIBR|nr:MULTISPECIES: hypothetical protein [Vibrio]ANO34768.1 hypothetical protein A6E01_16385 [Vibrio breoganii]MDN3715738.1 hypothetical protein [Vibrio breoganii]NMO75114.1 hypothetical protein [Vibrio breoganii]NMR68854.1 hypothetical protein [Vibrio breoganii]OCH75736.1 hypothetical protein A6D95_10990 [Vibrio breoganii]
MKKFIYLSCVSSILALFTATKAMALTVNPPPTQQTFVEQVRCGGYAAFLAKEANISHYEDRMFRHIEQATVTTLALNPGISDGEALISSTSEVARQLGWEQANAYHSGDMGKYQKQVMNQYIDQCS